MKGGKRNTEEEQPKERIKMRKTREKVMSREKVENKKERRDS